MTETATAPDDSTAAKPLADSAWAVLVDEAVGKAGEGIDFPNFEAWLLDRLVQLPLPAPWSVLAADYASPQQFGQSVARALWRVMPLPTNDFRGFSLPDPGRNEPCFCGSGDKYKQCCERRLQSVVAAVNPELLWDAVLPGLEPAAVARLATQGRVPLWPLGEYVADLAEDDRLEEAAACLAPIFAPPLRYIDDEAAALLADLSNLYAELGEFEAQDELLLTISQQAPRSFLRAEACHLMGGLLADEGAWDDAFDFLHAALDDTPEDPRLGVLELRLLVAVGQLEAASQAAARWRQLAEDTLAEPPPPDEPDELVELYRAAAVDPAGTLLAAILSELPEADAQFLADLPVHCQRPLPAFSLVPVDAPPEGEIPAEARVLLVTPAELDDLEREWRNVFPLAKPLGDGDEPADSSDPWIEPAWRDLLAARPEAWDSLWVLDDLVTAIAQYEYPQVVTWTRGFRQIVLRRAQRIIAQALGERPITSLPWECPENRPALRSLRRLAALEM